MLESVLIAVNYVPSWYTVIMGGENLINVCMQSTYKLDGAGLVSDKKPFWTRP